MKFYKKLLKLAKKVLKFDNFSRVLPTVSAYEIGQGHRKEDGMFSFLATLHNKRRYMDLTLLDQVSAAIVYQLKSVGVYHYNKLLYLTEYLFIKNFGKRLTAEEFIKLPHGPVVSNYKKQISELAEHGYFSVDLETLNVKRQLNDESIVGRIEITATEKTAEALPQDTIVKEFVYGVINRYAHLSVGELEAVVYATSPVVNYKKSMFKPATGGKILVGDCIRMKDYKNEVSEGRRIAWEHLRKYPTVNQEQQNLLKEEFASLISMRPQHE